MSININSRETKIINILKNAVEPLSGVALSEEIGCSTKTIQSDIKNIYKTNLSYLKLSFVYALLTYL